MAKPSAEALPEEMEFDPRYYIETAKNSIESPIHIFEEAITNEDEAISGRAKRDEVADEGTITVNYDPDEMLLVIVGDGKGMTATEMRSRLKRVGDSPQEDSKRGFFHRGIREVFLAMGGGEVISIGMMSGGRQVLSKAVFGDTPEITIDVEDIDPSPEQRAELGLEGTGTAVRIPVHRFAEGKPKLFSFPALERQITDCVGLRPVLTDPNRKIYLEYGDATPRRLAFEYPIREPLVSKREIKVAGEKGTFWADLTEQPVKQRVGRRARVAGILMRGERAAYEVSRGSNLAGNPVMMTRVVGELRIDSIEDLQRHASNDDQHIYKADRSGLNPEHPLVEGAYKLIDEILGPLIAGLDADEEQTRTTPDMRRELQKLARVINQEIAGASVLGPEDEGGDPVEEPDGGGETDDPPPPPPRPEPIVRELKDPIEFPHGRIFVYAGHSRTIAVWFDGDEIAEGSLVEVVTPVDEFVTQATLSADLVPPAAGDGVAELRLTVKGGNLEGRHEVTVRSGGHVATLPVHVRFPRASGFISQIVTVDQDWEIGSALWDPSTGVVKVYIGRPEFRDAKARASRAGEKVAWRHPEYRQLVVESVREAALWEAAKQKAEVDLDEMSAEDRKEGDAFHNLVRFHFQELDYRLRAKLHKAFAQGGKSG